MKAQNSILLILFFFFLSCSKDPLIEESKSRDFYLRTNSQKDAKQEALIHIEIIDDRLVFQNSDDFAQAMWYLETHNLEEWRKSISIKTYPPKEEQGLYAIETFDPQLSSLLNTKGIVQINPYLFKFLPEEEKILVIDTQFLHHYLDFEMANSSTAYIQEFYFDEDVWNLLEEQNGDLASTKALCKEARAKNKTVSQEALSNNISPYVWHKARIYLLYNRFGIWEKVKCVFTNQRHDIFTNSTFIPAQVSSWELSYHFDERCGEVIDGSLSIASGEYSEEIIILRSDKKALEENQSTISCNLSFEYIPNNSESTQSLSLLLDNF
ncbi:MAG: hypothetical protein H6579_06495 [Chitinophagales bacterium]|nr:hypothetical protein [Bacteroidota bacterium]MCB9256758.1 hypothetical protein [Chitinophagales bacterium]